MMHPHIYNSDNKGMNTDILPGLIPPRIVRKSPTPPTDRSLIGWGLYIIEPQLHPPGDDKVPTSVKRSCHKFFKLDKPGKQPGSLGSTPPRTVWKPAPPLSSKPPLSLLLRQPRCLVLLHYPPAATVSALAPWGSTDYVAAGIAEGGNERSSTSGVAAMDIAVAAVA